MLRKLNRSVHIKLIIPLFFGTCLSVVLLLGLRFSQATTPGPRAQGYRIELLPDQMALTPDVTICGDTITDPTVASWCHGVPTGTIMLGVDPESANPLDWDGGAATAEVFLADVYSPTVVVLKLSSPDQSGRGLRSPDRNRMADIALDGRPLWNVRTTHPGTSGHYYGTKRSPILTTIVLTQSITHTLTISVPAHTAWDLSQIELIAYPYPSTIKGIGYSPFRDCQYPGGVLQPSIQDIEEDLFRLFHTSNAIRTYSARGVNGEVVTVANKIGLPVYAGAWIDGTAEDPEEDEEEIQALIDLACTKRLEGLIVGNEYFLRSARTQDDIDYLLERIREVKDGIQQCGKEAIPVTTAEIDNLMFYWEGLDDFDPGIDDLYDDILEEIDFVMVHIYPFWQEDGGDSDYGRAPHKGMPIEGAADFTVRRYKAIQTLLDQQYDGKEVIIGEAGWPSGGTSNGIAVPSPENQRRYMLEFLYLAEKEGVEFMYFDAFDELWKVEEPGRVGQHWGYSYTDRAAKYNVYGVLVPVEELFPNKAYLPYIAVGSSSSTSQISLSRSFVDLGTVDTAPRNLIQTSSGVTFPVFTEWPMGPGFFVPSGWMGYTDTIGIYECDRSDPYRGEMAVRVSFSPTGSHDSAGVYWQYPENNWGTISKTIDLSYTNKLTFRARGQDGGERIRFFVGGIGTEDDPYPESLRPEISSGFIELTKTWEAYTINLRGQDLTQVIGGFGWASDKCASPNGATFYLDDIVFDYDPDMPDPPSPGPIFPVYTDAAAQDNHYFPSGRMGDNGDILFSECYTGTVHSGSTAIRVEYTANGDGPHECDGSGPCNWAGVYWQHPAENWGDRPGGYNLTGARALTFWAKGQNGGEWVSFKAGGIGCDSATYPDSLCPAQTIDPCPIDLTDTWQVYTIRLSADLNLSSVVGGFLWAASQHDNPTGTTFYLDDIQYLFDVDVPLQPHWVYYGPMLACGYDMGVNTSGGRTDWVTDMGGYMRMDYPSGQSWGAVFITVGPPRASHRPGKDLSSYQTLSLELRGEVGGEDIWIGLKDNTDRDDGSETKHLVQDLTTDWQAFTFPLSEFRTADLTRLYVVTEFVFESGTPAETVYFRRIQYLP